MGDRVKCPACGCTVYRWSARLGKFLWRECRDCGMQYYRIAEGGSK